MSERREKARDALTEQGIAYDCGCAGVRDEAHSTPNWNAYAPKCPTHDEPLSAESLVAAMMRKANS